MGCAGSTAAGDLYDEDFDLDSPPVTDEETQLHAEIEALLAQQADILDQLSSYQGCAEYIKLAVRTPSTENDVAAWNAVVPAVNMLKHFFDYYAAFKDGLMKLLVFVCKGDPAVVLPAHLATARQLIQMFDFIIRFDELKMSKASIQNDFSFYRRSMNRMKRGNVDLNVSQPPVNDEVANRMSLFFAYPNPFTKALIDEFGKPTAGITNESLQRTFSVVAKATRSIILHKDDKDMMYYRALVASMMFYDYTSAQGVFVNRSGIDAASSITCLKKLESVDLLNTIRYGSRTFNSDSTPKKIKDMMT